MKIGLLFSNPLDRYRKNLRWHHPKEEVLKGIKWLLLKHREDLTGEEQNRLEAAFERFPQLEQCYLLKETFRLWFNHFDCPQKAGRFLDFWIDQAKALENRYLDRFLRTLLLWLWCN